MSNVKIVNLSSQIAQLKIIRDVALGTLATITVANNDTRDYVTKLQGHIDALEAKLQQERIWAHQSAREQA